MAIGAQVENIEVLARFKVALVKFVETCQSALGDAEADIQRTLTWLESEQYTHWTTQIRHRTDALAKAQDALRQKKLYKDVTGGTQSAIEEMKAVQLCQKRLAEGQEKLAAVKSWGKRLQKEGLLYKGTVQRFATNVQSDMPNAIAHLGGLLDALKQYAAVQMSGGTVGPMDPSIAAFFSAAGGGGMSRGTSGAPGATSDLDRYIKLRGRTPSSQMRPTLPTGDAEAKKPWQPSAFDEKQRQLVSGLAVKWVVPAAGEKLVIGPGVDESADLFLERAQGAAAGDSGWYIGTVATPPPAAVLGPRDRVIAVEQALILRPDISQLLGLPPGSLAVVGPDGVVAVLDEANQDIWAAAMEQNADADGGSAVEKPAVG